MKNKNITVEYLMDRNLSPRMIYVIFFSDGSIYVGTTCRTKEKRMEEHLRNDCTVSKYLNKHNVTYEIVTASDYIDAIESSIRENGMMHHYKEMGHNVINEQWNVIGVYNEELIWNLDVIVSILESEIFENRSQFETKYGGAMNWLRRNGLFDEILDKYLPTNIEWWDLERIINILETETFNGRKEFQLKYSGARQWLDKNDLFNEIMDKYTPLDYMNLDKIIIILETEEIKGRGDFAKDFPTAHRWLRDNDLYDEIADKYLPLLGWNLEKIINILETETFTGRSDFIEVHGGASNWLNDNDLYDEIMDKYLPLKYEYWDLEKTINVLETETFDGRSEFYSKYKGAYGWLKTSGSFDDVMDKYLPLETESWNLDKVINILETETFDGRSEFYSKYKGAYGFLRRKKILKEVMDKYLPKITWNLEKIINILKTETFDSKEDFRKKYSYASKWLSMEKITKEIMDKYFVKTPK